MFNEIDENNLVIHCPIPQDLEIRDHDRYLFVSNRQRDLTHAIHKYPAKFIPDIPNWFIRKYTQVGDTVLDPFMGSGTTNLEALLMGRNSIGVDVDAFSRFIARTKNSPISDVELIEPFNELSQKIRSEYSPDREYPSPDFPYKDNWFKAYISNELGFIKSTIACLDCSQQVRSLFLLSMSAIVKEVSEANHNCLRTCIRRNNRKDVLEGAALSKFLKKLEFNVSAVRQLNEALASCDRVGEVQILNADAKCLRGVPDNSVSLAVTSPPYLNAIDYPRTHQLEMYWLGFAKGSLTELKKNQVGTESIKADYYRQLIRTGCPEADSVITEIFKVDKRRAGIASRYVSDMFANLDEVKRTLKKGARYVIVIGNNRMRGQLFETWKYLTWYAGQIGLETEHKFVSGIINHFMKIPREQQMHDDHVLILKA